MNRYLATLPLWLSSTVVFAALLILGLIVQWLLFWLAARVAARTQRFSHSFMLKHSRAPSRVLIPLLLVSFVLRDLPLPP